MLSEDSASSRTSKLVSKGSTRSQGLRPRFSLLKPASPRVQSPGKEISMDSFKTALELVLHSRKKHLTRTPGSFCRAELKEGGHRWGKGQSQGTKDQGGSSRHLLTPMQSWRPSSISSPSGSLAALHTFGKCSLPPKGGSFILV